MVYHILNGDALKEKFPKSLDGICIVARECLVDGPVDGDTLQELYVTRAKYLNANYNIPLNDNRYEEDVIPELEKIQNIEPGSNVYLWFEDDLFCQVNFWFIIHQLNIKPSNLNIHLIRPYEYADYGFGCMKTSDLELAFNTKISLIQYPELNKLWKLYQSNDFILMEEIGRLYKDDLPFLWPCIQAHIERNLTNHHLGRPEKTLVFIINSLNNPGFGSVFQAFCKLESIYGFGDLQVKRLYDQVIESLGLAEN